MSSEEQDKEMVKQAAAALGEHFDTVQVFVTRHAPDEGGTISFDWGCGSWFARKGQVSDWIVRSDQIVRDHASKTTNES